MANRLTPLSSLALAPLRVVADRVASRSVAPRSASDLDAAWLDRMLGLPGGSVTRSEVREQDHGTSLRVRLEVFHGGTSTSVFIKHTPVRMAAKVFNLVTRLCEHEVHFYRSLASQSGCAPTALATEWHAATGRSTLVLPDLCDEGYQFLEITETITADQAAKAVEAMAGLHRAFWRSSGAGISGEYLPANHFSTIGTPLLSRHLGGGPEAIAEQVPAGFIADLHVLRDHAWEINGLFNSFDQSLLHNDSHQGNIAYREDKAMLLDWQVCSVGSAMKDLAYFMSTIDSDVRRGHERDLLQLYLDVVTAGDGPVIGWDDAWNQYRILAITGFIAAATTALFGDRLQNADNARVGLQRSVSSLVDLESFKAVQQALVG